jgi:hypothetical protein
MAPNFPFFFFFQFCDVAIINGWLAGWQSSTREELSQIQQQAKEGNFFNKIEKNKNSCAYMLTTSWNLFLNMVISEIIYLLKI